MAIGKTNVTGGQYMRPVLITSSQTWTAPYSGKYRACAVGAGSDGTADGAESSPGNIEVSRVGTCGGAGYVEIILSKGQQIPITITDLETKFGDYISATAGTQGTLGVEGLSGNVIGSNVVPFESNHIRGQQSIIPPEIYADLVAEGGYSGTDGTQTPTNKSGGDGIFGGIGGYGGDYIEKQVGVNYARVGTVGKNGGIGAGKGGSGYVVSNYTSAYVTGAGTGGGALGAGGGAGTPVRISRAVWMSYGHGFGGSGGVYIEKI